MREVARWTVLAMAAAVACGCSAQVEDGAASESSEMNIGGVVARGPGGGVTLNVPVITSVFGFNVNGGQTLTLLGTNFGTSPGRVILTGNFGVTSAFDLEDVSWGTEVEGDWHSLVGIPLSQSAEVQLVTASGLLSNKVAFQMQANIVEGFFPGSLADNTACSGNAGKSNSCGTSGYAITGVHVDTKNPTIDYDVQGSDYYYFPQLKNGWTYTGYGFSGPEYTYGVIDRNALVGFAYGATSEYVAVNWSTDQTWDDSGTYPWLKLPLDTAQYQLTLQISGPEGMAYQ